MDKHIMNIGGGKGSVSLLVRILLISSFVSTVVSQYPGFYWRNEYLVEPIPSEPGIKLIAVIERENLTVQCFVRTNRVGYEIHWDYKDFHATNTTTSIIQGANGAKHAVSNLTVNPDNPADIEDKVVICMKENGVKIALKFKVYVYVNDTNEPCNSCDGTTAIKLKRWGNKKTLDQSLQQGFEDNLIKKLQKQNYEKVYQKSDIDGTSYICGCKKKAPTPPPPSPPPPPTPPTPPSPPPPPPQNPIWGIIGGIFGSLVILGGASLGYMYRHCIDNWLKKFNLQNEDDKTVEQNEDDGTTVEPNEERTELCVLNDQVE